MIRKLVRDAEVEFANRHAARYGGEPGKHLHQIRAQMAVWCLEKTVSVLQDAHNGDMDRAYARAFG